jgi:hypothetical protein
MRVPKSTKTFDEGRVNWDRVVVNRSTGFNRFREGLV